MTPRPGQVAKMARNVPHLAGERRERSSLNASTSLNIPPGIKSGTSSQRETRTFLSALMVPTRSRSLPACATGQLAVHEASAHWHRHRPLALAPAAGLALSDSSDSRPGLAPASCAGGRMLVATVRCMAAGCQWPACNFKLKLESIRASASAACHMMPTFQDSVTRRGPGS
jgi:hypothetical protein